MRSTSHPKSQASFPLAVPPDMLLTEFIDHYFMHYGHRGFPVLHDNTGCASISYTYTEPTIFMEYALDVAREAHRAGIRNVFVTNGYMSGEALEIISPFLDAANVDLKAFNDHFYSEVCGAHLKPVLTTLEGMKDLGIWVEVTTLIIPGLNDDPKELRAMARFLTNLGPETPWHVTAFYPAYRMKDHPSTPVESLRKARLIGMEAGLRYVYTGNVPGEEGENTYCHRCGTLLIERIGYATKVKGLDHGSCIQCGAPMAGPGLRYLGCESLEACGEYDDDDDDDDDDENNDAGNDEEEQDDDDEDDDDAGNDDENDEYNENNEDRDQESPGTLEDYAKSNSITFSSRQELVDHPDMRAFYEKWRYSAMKLPWR